MARKAKKKATKRKTATKRKSSTRSRKKSSGEMLLVASKTKDVLRAHDCNIASDALEGLNGWVYWLLEQAAKRTVANGRKTVRAHDFLVM